MLIYLPLEATAISTAHYSRIIIRTLIVQIFPTDLIRHSSLADRAWVFALKPLRDAFIVESMQAWQNDIFLFYHVAFLANRTLLVLFTKIGCVCLCKLAFREKFKDLRGHRIDHIFVQL